MKYYDLARFIIYCIVWGKLLNSIPSSFTISSYPSNWKIHYIDDLLNVCYESIYLSNPKKPLSLNIYIVKNPGNPAPASSVFQWNPQGHGRSSAAAAAFAPWSLVSHPSHRTVAWTRCRRITGGPLRCLNVALKRLKKQRGNTGETPQGEVEVGGVLMLGLRGIFFVVTKNNEVLYGSFVTFGAQIGCLPVILDEGCIGNVCLWIRHRKFILDSFWIVLGGLLISQNSSNEIF